MTFDISNKTKCFSVFDQLIFLSIDFSLANFSQTEAADTHCCACSCVS